MTRHIKNYFFILLGAALYALTFNGFFAANSVAFGGVTGLAQLVNAFVPALPVEWYLRRAKSKEAIEKHAVIGEEANRKAGYDAYLAQIRKRVVI